MLRGETGLWDSVVGIGTPTHHPSCLCLLKTCPLCYRIKFAACLFICMCFLQLQRVELSGPPYSRLITVCLKDHSLTSLAERSANIAALLFLLVSFHTSLTTTTSLPDMESSTQRVRPPMTRTHSDACRQPPPPPPQPPTGTSWPSLAVFSRLFQQCQSHLRGKSKSWARASQTEKERETENARSTDVLYRIMNASLLKFSIG